MWHWLEQHFQVRPGLGNFVICRNGKRLEVCIVHSFEAHFLPDILQGDKMMSMPWQDGKKPKGKSAKVPCRCRM
jgi:hypothetical protein